jgi:hypothetical protein
MVALEIPARRRGEVLRTPEITDEAIAAYREERGGDLHVILGLKSWEISPLLVATIPEPSPETDIVWLQSWWLADALRRELQTFCGRSVITFELDEGDLK